MFTKLASRVSQVMLIGVMVAGALLGAAGDAAAQQSNGGSGSLVSLVPSAASLTAKAVADVGIIETDGSTTFTLAVRGLDAAPGTAYDARLHVGVCTVGDSGAVGPAYADTGTLIGGGSGTVSLPFVVSAVGTGSAQATVPFLIPAGHANSIVLFDARGSSVACLRVTIAAPAPVEAPEEVLGVTQTPADATTLAFTGSESSAFAAAGLGLIAAGAAVLAGRRHLREQG